MSEGADAGLILCFWLVGGLASAIHMLTSVALEPSLSVPLLFVDAIADGVAHSLPVVSVTAVGAWLVGATIVNASSASRSHQSRVKAATRRWGYGLFNNRSDYRVEPNVGGTRTSILPLRLARYDGTAIALIALAYASFLVLRTVMHGIDVPGYAALMVVMVLLGALTLLTLPVGAGIGRMGIEERRTPIHVVG